MKPVTTRYINGEIHAYHVSSDVHGPLELAASFKVEAPSETQAHAVAPSLDRAVYSTSQSVVCIGQDGDVLWHYDLGTTPVQDARSPDCAFSLKGDVVWVYRPDAMADRSPDHLVVLRSETGEEVARTELDTVGEGAFFTLHPDGEHILFDVGEGQDGVKIYRAALAEDGIDLHSYGQDDRKLVDIAPDGRSFMTVDLDFAFHAFPSGEVFLRIPIETFGYEDGQDEDGNDVLPHWNGGYLDADVAIVTIAGENDDEEWHCRYSIDLRTGTLLGRFEAESLGGEDFEPLGDGTWIVSGQDGSILRRRKGP